MRLSRTETLYREYVIDLGLERSTLFEALAMRRPRIETGGTPSRSGAPGYYIFERIRDHAGR